MKLSVTSVMLPRWTLEETFENLAAFGYVSLEDSGPRDGEEKVRSQGEYLRSLQGNRTKWMIGEEVS